MFRRLLTFLQPDDAVWLVLIARVVMFISTPITLLLVATRFSPVYQGFYYTFTSITTLTLLLELGLGMVLVQFASHEFAHLHWQRDGSLDGDPQALARIIGTLTKAGRWYLVVTVGIIAIVIPGGLRFFATQGRTEHVTFAAPWILLISMTALGMLFVPIQSVIEGCGRVTDVQRVRLWQSVVSNLLLWLGILTGQALYAAGLAAAATVIVPAVWLARSFPGLVRQTLRTIRVHHEAHISWRDELLPMQWRIAVSWLAGAMTSSLFNPLLFRYQGAVVAGQMGMSLSLANAPYVLGMSWLVTRMPRYGTLIRRGEYDELDAMARRGTKQATLVWAAGSCGLLAVIAIGQHLVPRLAHRVLPVSAVAALCVASLVNVLMQSMAGYLRAHKKEPYVAISVVTGVLVAGACWATAKYGSVMATAVTYAAIVLLVQLPIASTIFVRKREEWHRAPDQSGAAAPLPLTTLDIGPLPSGSA